MGKGTLGFSVHIFIPSGEPEGLRIVEKSNWIGRGVVFPRSLFSEARKHPELKRFGVYVLWGPGESEQLPIVYVGEGRVLSRLRKHVKEKDFWTHAAVFTSRDLYLTKSHVEYLEARLITLARDAKRCELDNSGGRPLPDLSEADKAAAESFLADVLLCLPMVGVNAFEMATGAKGRTLYLKAKTKGIDARGIDAPEGFIVLADSTAAKSESGSIRDYLSKYRRDLIKKKVLTTQGRVLRLTQNWSFESPSRAAGVFLGREADGRIEWKDAEERTLKSIQEAEASET
jgi:hypothetical protein